MTQKEKENRIHSFALEFLERQQIVPNLYADQIIRGYKEGYLQAEQDLEVKEMDLENEFFDWYHEEKNRDYNASILYERYGIISKKLAKHFYELGLKTKGE